MQSGDYAGEELRAMESTKNAILFKHEAGDTSQNDLARDSRLCSFCPRPLPSTITAAFDEFR